MKEGSYAHLLLRGEVVHDVEQLADLLRRLHLDHVGHSLAANVTAGGDNPRQQFDA